MAVQVFALGRRLCTSTARGSGRVLHVLFLRLKHSNLPLFIAFMSALFMFLRALTGAGYTEPYAAYAPEGTSVLAHNLSQPAAAAWVPDAHNGFADHWVHFKKVLFTCPEKGADRLDDTEDIEIDESDVLRGDADMDTKPQRKTGVHCLKERLRSAMRVREDLLKGKAPAVKKEDGALGVSLAGLPARRDRPGTTAESGTEGSLDMRTAQDESNSPPVRWKQER